MNQGAVILNFFVFFHHLILKRSFSLELKPSIVDVKPLILNFPLQLILAAKRLNSLLLNINSLLLNINFSLLSIDLGLCKMQIVAHILAKVNHIRHTVKLEGYFVDFLFSFCIGLVIQDGIVCYFEAEYIVGSYFSSLVNRVQQMQEHSAFLFVFPLSGTLENRIHKLII